VILIALPGVYLVSRYLWAGCALPTRGGDGKNSGSSGHRNRVAGRAWQAGIRLTVAAVKSTSGPGVRYGRRPLRSGRDGRPPRHATPPPASARNT